MSNEEIKNEFLSFKADILTMFTELETKIHIEFENIESDIRNFNIDHVSTQCRLNMIEEKIDMIEEKIKEKFPEDLL